MASLKNEGEQSNQTFSRRDFLKLTKEGIKYGSISLLLSACEVEPGDIVSTPEITLTTTVPSETVVPTLLSTKLSCLQVHPICGNCNSSS